MYSLSIHLVYPSVLVLIQYNMERHNQEGVDQLMVIDSKDIQLAQYGKNLSIPYRHNQEGVDQLIAIDYSCPDFNTISHGLIYDTHVDTLKQALAS